MQLPPYEFSGDPRFELKQDFTVLASEVVQFLQWVIDRDDLEIARYFPLMTQEPFFLVAATGLGKTVGVPVHVLLRQLQKLAWQPNPAPRVWIVEPRIPIAIGLAAFMNSLWERFASESGVAHPPLFGCISSVSGNSNPDAPITFVTTGIFELTAKAGELTPERDRVVIDEAHVTIEQNPGVELGIALARKAGVTIDYMSATVDTDNLEETLGLETIIKADAQRYPIWMHNLGAPAVECLPELIQHTLIAPDTSSSYFPQPHNYAAAGEVCQAVAEPGRAHGMLVVVNSFAGDYSDTARLKAIIQKAHPDLSVLQLASEVVRDRRLLEAFETQLANIERDHQPYVVLATSVVEMGITFPTLDFVVTMDSGYEQETVGDVTFPVVAPLGVNSLRQRIGRVGRRRPGIAFITNEVGAFYAELDDEELNDKQTLPYEPIRFPLAASPLMPLAYYACQQGWRDIDAEIRALALPSRLADNSERMAYLHEQFANLEALGLTEDYVLTPLGISMEKWVGRVDLAYAVQLQKSLTEDAKVSDVMFWVVATALSNSPAAALRTPHDYFVDYEGKHEAIAHIDDVWSHWANHEDVSVFKMFATAASYEPDTLFKDGWFEPDSDDLFDFRVWCNSVGVDIRKLRKAAKAVEDTWQLLWETNGESSLLRNLFESEKAPKLLYLPWRQLLKAFPESGLWSSLYTMPGSVTVRLVFDEDTGFYTWIDTVNGRSGTIFQDNTPVPLNGAQTLIARIVPSRQAKGDATMWRLAHIGR
ncbi:MAG TPA: helicase-related protein [Verrucomicrobiae bacterium]|nr:helicase-related protein [Verrucomicrobiae bacterium]